jgi:hemoglobin
MKHDIRNPNDIELLVNSFYEKVKQDDLIAHFFTEVNWQQHLPVMYDFWTNSLFYTGTYTGNPMKTHKDLHSLKALSAADFDRWLHHFLTTIQEHFEGDKAELAKQKALSMATVMKIKILHPPANNSLI